MRVSRQSPLSWARRSAAGLAVVYMAAVLGVMLRAGSPEAAWWWLALIPFFGWAVAPVVVSALIIRSQIKPIPALISSSLFVLAVVAGIYIYLESMFGDGARSTSGLIFIFLPIYQWALPLILLLITALGSVGDWRRND